MFEVRGMTGVSKFRIWGQAWISFYANNHDDTVADPGTLHSCAGQLS